MKYSIHFNSGAIAPVALKNKMSKVESFLRINVPYGIWKKNSSLNISSSTNR